MSQEELQALLQFFKVLADENRLRLLGILAEGERSVEELAVLLHLKAPTISHHLARLKELKLVEMRVEGNTHFYWLNTDALDQASKVLLTPGRLAAFADDVEGDAWERKVLRDFFDGPRLKEIPSGVKKRNVILKWFANQFAYDTMYKEAEVNGIIQRHHIDSAFFRRELIGSRMGLLQRDKNIYWRVSPELANTEHRRKMLEQIIAQFEPFKAYNEDEISETIRRFSSDYPFLRRELIEENMLLRASDKYIAVPGQNK